MQLYGDFHDTITAKVLPSFYDYMEITMDSLHCPTLGHLHQRLLLTDTSYTKDIE